MNKVIPIEPESNMQKLMDNEDLQYMRLKTDCEAVFFVSSSGHCTFDCEYCIVNPIAKKEESLIYEDLAFLLEQFDCKSFLIFSGKGDFFAGYSRSQRLLERVLDHNVEIALDINGSVLQEFPHLSQGKLDKIRYINLTMHYNEIKRKNLFSTWAKNALILIEKKPAELLLGYIMSPQLSHEWAEALAFYQAEIFAKTGKGIVMVRDVAQAFTLEQEQLFEALHQQYADAVSGTHNNDFAKIFEHNPNVLCPAGHRYFRIWNDGSVQACPYLPELNQSGNLKQREIQINPQAFACSTPEFCDCHVIEGLGRMEYQEKQDESVELEAAQRCFI
ncbi:hypothetical protein [Candidatus Albibeggiatoa sp. nov. BB20]|uniref:hypothetical protein n=1 Tax=Candidatus Albibeggiatoa sp. nov. BB20 TaxID=3162723 RepID=UPI0033659484